MATYYSRREQAEQRKNVRKAFTLAVITIALMGVMVFYGIPLIVRYSSFLGDLKKSSSPISIDDDTPPPPPHVDTLPVATNNQSIDINGSTEEGAKVFVSVNSEEFEILANKSGRFSLTINLVKGENKVFVKVKDNAGNESERTNTYTIVYDTEPPKLEIISPADQSQYYGTSQRQVNIEGSSEGETKVTVNERVVVVSGEGRFTYTTLLSQGENKFKIKSEDSAGNTTEKEITLNYSE